MSSELTQLVAQLEEQEARLQFTHFTHADAWTLGSLLTQMGTERQLGITIDIRKGDQQVFHAALEGTTADNDEWINRKIRTVRRFGHSSFLVGRRAEAEGADFHDLTGLPIADYAAHGGCFPILVKNVGLIGTVTVSGLPQQDDHALVIEALERFLAQ
ncbi:MAG TPA: heme-degrading domain-containing protein [Glaciihabitans sp.]|jgi:uncharacterized protein (UPF0303 family)|nr:heme-degrading domain-containing protein [Glaciihabitans sp.]